MADHNIQHVVVDSGGFIRNAPLNKMADKIYTIHNVVEEIRDKTTRQRLQVLPYQIIFREPTAEAISAVTNFSKKTGDYRSLSAVDIRVMALTYQLEKETNGSDHLKTIPQQNTTWTTTSRNLEKPTDIAGFYLKKESKVSNQPNPVSNTSNAEQHNVLENQIDSLTIGNSVINNDSKENSSQNHIVTEELVDSKVTDERLLKDGDTISTDELLDAESDEGEESGESEDDDDDDDDDDGWITPSNIKAVKKAMGDVNIEKAVVAVGCLTTDFAMQNVLIQMGLNVISVDGMLIKRAKSYALRCHACMKVTTNMLKEFCPNCGNKTLQRVSMTVNEDGSIQYYLSTRRPMNARGTKYSLPKPQGGKHANNPILCEDQLTPQQRAHKMGKIQYNVFDPDYTSYDSPFAPIDTQSRSARLGIRAGSSNSFQKRQNPNVNKKRTGGRKK